MTNSLPKSLPKLQELSSVLDKPLTFIDLETTGMPHEQTFQIIEIGLIHINHNCIIAKESLVKPNIKIPRHITELTGINYDMVSNKPMFSHFSPYLTKIAKNHILCGFNSKSFDSKGMEKLIYQHSNEIIKFNNQIDVKHIYGRHVQNLTGTYSQKGTLTQIAKELNISLSSGTAHRALYDITLTVLIAEKLLSLNHPNILFKDITKFENKNLKEKYLNYLFKLSKKN